MPMPDGPSGMPAGRTTLRPTYTPVAGPPASGGIVAISSAAAMRRLMGRNVMSIWPPMVEIDTPLGSM